MREPLTPRDVRRLLAEHALAPRKSSGQNFVVDPNTVRKIVRDAGVGPDDVVLEIGPGLGSLTIPLAGAARRVVAVEIDAGLVRALDEVLAGVDNVEVVHADALRVDLAALVDGGPARLVANLPYNVATPLVMQALAAGHAFGDLFVMVQREVGERWTAEVGDPLYSSVTVKVALVADAEIVADVPRNVFYPVPNVDSVTVRITRRADVDDASLGTVVSVVEAAFAQRRKTLRNTLSRIADRDAVDRALARCGLAGNARPESLDAAAFQRLAAALDAETRGGTRTMGHGNGGAP